MKYKIITTRSVFEHYYIVPEDFSDHVIGNVKEAGQNFITESEIGSVVFDEEAMLKFFDQKNNYLSHWTKEQKLSFLKGLIDE